MRTPPTTRRTSTSFASRWTSSRAAAASPLVTQAPPGDEVAHRPAGGRRAEESEQPGDPAGVERDERGRLVVPSGKHHAKRDGPQIHHQEEVQHALVLRQDADAV